MNNQYPKEVLIGTCRSIKAQLIEGTGCTDPENPRQFIPSRFIPASYEWQASDQRRFTEGLLHGFFSEGELSDDEGLTVVGLVEHADGTFDTYAAVCLKLKNPTLQTNEH